MICKKTKKNVLEKAKRCLLVFLRLLSQSFKNFTKLRSLSYRYHKISKASSQHTQFQQLHEWLRKLLPNRHNCSRIQ